MRIKGGKTSGGGGGGVCVRACVDVAPPVCGWAWTGLTGEHLEPHFVQFSSVHNGKYIMVKRKRWVVLKVPGAEREFLC